LLTFVIENRPILCTSWNCRDLGIGYSYMLRNLPYRI